MVDKRKYADRKEHLKKAVAKRRKSIRQKAIEYKGGVCQLCRYDKCSEAFEFHHFTDEKNFGISQKGLGDGKERVGYLYSSLCELSS